MTILHTIVNKIHHTTHPALEESEEAIALRQFKESLHVDLEKQLSEYNKKSSKMAKILRKEQTSVDNNQVTAQQLAICCAEYLDERVRFVNTTADKHILDLIKHYKNRSRTCFVPELSTQAKHIEEIVDYLHGERIPDMVRFLNYRFQGPEVITTREVLACLDVINMTPQVRVPSEDIYRLLCANKRALRKKIMQTAKQQVVFIEAQDIPSLQ